MHFVMISPDCIVQLEDVCHIFIFSKMLWTGLKFFCTPVGKCTFPVVPKVFPSASLISLENIYQGAFCFSRAKSCCSLWTPGGMGKLS